MNKIVAVARRRINVVLPPSPAGTSPPVDFVLQLLGRPARLQLARTACQLFRAMREQIWFNLPTDTSFTPGPGDLVFYSRDDRLIHEVGIVEKIDLSSGQLWVIAADEAGQVGRRGYWLHDPKIVAFARP